MPPSVKEVAKTVDTINKDIGKLYERTDTHQKEIKELSALPPMIQILTDQLNILLDKRSEDAKLVHKHEWTIKELTEAQEHMSKSIDQIGQTLQDLLKYKWIALGVVCTVIWISGGGLEKLKQLIMEIPV